jgi:hypothetical protein
MSERQEEEEEEVVVEEEKDEENSCFFGESSKCGWRNTKNTKVIFQIFQR